MHNRLSVKVVKAQPVVNYAFLWNTMYSASLTPTVMPVIKTAANTIIYLLTD
jgi:hypothetical protein